MGHLLTAAVSAPLISDELQLELREYGELAQGYADRLWSQDLNSGPLIPRPSLFPMNL